LVRWHIRRVPWVNRIIVKLDDILGYGKQLGTDIYWQ
jgi:hypothetical protein